MWQRLFWVCLLMLGGAAAFAGAAAQTPAPTPITGLSLHHDRLPSLAAVAPLRAQAGAESQPAVQLLPRQARPIQPGSPARLPLAPNLRAMPVPQFNFAGLGNDDNLNVLGYQLLPPDPIGEVGRTHYIQWVNKIFAVWQLDRSDNTAALVYGPAAGNTLWSGFGGLCETHNSGDPIVNYDSLAGRWVMTQPAWAGEILEYHQCVAVSESEDPLGGWLRYDFLISDSKMNDYPHLSVWGDAYYLSFNQFGGGWAGQGAVAFERSAMLAGQAAQIVYFDLFSTDPNLGGMLAADADGPAAPPAGSPGVFVEMDDDRHGYSPDQLQLWLFAVNWADPPASTFTRLQIIELEPPGLPFDTYFCDAYRAQCIPQPEVSNRLETLADRLMPRVVYRNFGSYEALALNHTVDVDGTAHAGIRWYELRRAAGGEFTLYQAGDYAPDADHRWMGSLAFDRAGNLALGYTVSGAHTFPSIRYTGRLAGDPLGALAQGEAELTPGGGSQTNFIGRWGDYSNLSVDPLDDCTFWFTHEYYPATSTVGWRTRIGSFRFPACATGPAGSLEGVVFDADSNQPIAGARLTAGEGIVTWSDENGYYRWLNLPVGDYPLLAAAYAYGETLAGEVTVSEGALTVRDIALASLPLAEARMSVSDGSQPGGAAAQGWPLYARVDLAADGFRAAGWSQPLSGAFTQTLFAQTPYSVTLSAPGYLPQTQAIQLSGNTQLHFTLWPDLLHCDAPGYSPEWVYFADFESSDGGFTVSGANPTWAWGAPASGPGHAHSGERLWATNLSGPYASGENSVLLSPPVNLSAHSGSLLRLAWQQWLSTELDYDFAAVEVSRDDGQTWQRVYGAVSGAASEGWEQRSVVLDASYASAAFRLRFGLQTNAGGQAEGFYVDDIGVSLLAVPASVGYSEDFEASDGGYTVSGTASWAWGAPQSGPQNGPGGAASGQFAWGASLTGEYGNQESGYLLSPLFDLSPFAGQTPLIGWAQWLQSESGFDFASLEASRDGGQTWQPVMSALSGEVDSQWNSYYAVLDPSFASADFRLRFRLRTDMAVTAPGFFVDDVRILLLPAWPQSLCRPLSGGLIAGQVFTAEAAGLPGALIAVQASAPPTLTAYSTLSQVTPGDPQQGDGFYLVFSPAGEQTLVAAFGQLRRQHPVTVAPSSLQQLDFTLPVQRVYLPFLRH